LDRVLTSLVINRLASPPTSSWTGLKSQWQVQACLFGVLAKTDF